MHIEQSRLNEKVRQLLTPESGFYYCGNFECISLGKLYLDNSNDGYWTVKYKGVYLGKVSNDLVIDILSNKHEKDVEDVKAEFLGLE